MTKFALYGLLTSFFQMTIGGVWLQSARQPSSGLWLLPWHVPPLLKPNIVETRKIKMFSLSRMRANVG